MGQVYTFAESRECQVQSDTCGVSAPGLKNNQTPSLHAYILMFDWGDVKPNFGYHVIYNRNCKIDNGFLSTIYYIIVFNK